MQKIIEFEEYVAENGIKLSWENGYDISCLIKGNAVIISANKEGLILLANHLVTFARNCWQNPFMLSLLSLRSTSHVASLSACTPLMYGRLVAH